MVNVEYLIATINRNDMFFLEEMNISDRSIVLNQNGKNNIMYSENNIMFSTDTKGVGINRNLGLMLTNAEYAFIVDDDMVFYDKANALMERALHLHPDADVIIFNFDYVKDGEFIKPRMKRAGSVNISNCLKYGICCTLIKMDSIRKKNISFSTLFGGGCLYSCGEDSLFFLDCITRGLRVYTYIEAIGKNVYRESTWFRGYNEKFFFDKGAWIACAFPKLKHIIKWYFIIKFTKISSFPLYKITNLVNRGIKGYKNMAIYQEK